MMFSSLTVKHRMFLAYGLAIGCMLALGITDWLKINELGETATSLGRVSATTMYRAGLFHGTAAQLFSNTRGILLNAQIGDWSSVEAALSAYSTKQALARESIAANIAAGVGPDGQLVLDRATADLDVLVPLFQHFSRCIRERNISEAVTVEHDQMKPILSDLDNAAKQLLDRQQRLMTEASDRAQSTASQARLLTGVLFGISGLVGVLAFCMVRDLDVRLKGNVQALSEGATQLTAAAAQVSSSSQSLARDSSEQAIMIEETSASAEEVNSMAKRNAEHALDATRLVAEAVESSEQANRAMNECVTTMDAIGTSSEKIAKIIDVIDKIAFQTNILALNAAVEAARAGEAGMGFAVVADEVRNLAQRCAQAAQETAVLIKESVANTAEGLQGVKLLIASGSKVNDVFSRIKVLVDEIGISSQEQGRGIDQIGRAIAKMEQSTQKGVANAEESAAAAEELNAQSDALRHVALQLGTMVGVGQGAYTEPPRGAPAPISVTQPNRSKRRRRPTNLPGTASPGTALVSGNADFDLDKHFTEF